jgi:hypothetical protein
MHLSLDKIELSSLRDNIVKIETAFRKKAKDLFDDKKISLKDYELIGNKCKQLLNLAAKINSLQFNKVLTDINEPAKKIIEATNSLEKAAAKIQEYRNLFDSLSSLVELLTDVSNAISGGGIAVIGPIVKKIKDISNRG